MLECSLSGDAMTDRTSDASDACHVKPPRLCMGCNGDIEPKTSTRGSPRLKCEPCREADKRRRDRMRDHSRRGRMGGAPQGECHYCAVCFGMPHRRPDSGCPKCGLPWAAEMNVRQAPTPSAWVWL